MTFWFCAQYTLLTESLFFPVSTIDPEAKSTDLRNPSTHPTVIDEFVSAFQQQLVIGELTLMFIFSMIAAEPPDGVT